VTYARALAQRFEQDSPMDAREAWVQCLVDGIDGVPQLRSRAIDAPYTASDLTSPRIRLAA
jgi:hypothetical protein